MPRSTAINPKTGKRYDWEAAQAAKKADAQEQAALQAQIGLLKRQQRAIEARSSLLTYTQFTMPDPEDPNDLSRSRYEAATFHRKVAAVLDKFLAGELLFDDGRPCTQLIFCMPPRHGKTELATKRLAAQYSGNHPEHDLIVAAAGDDLASDFGADIRAIIHSPQHKQVFPQHKLRRGGNAKDNIQTDKGGRLICAGRGGQINGRGAHLLLIDDLYKDANEARSPTIRDQAWDWLVKVALYRRMGKKLTIITMTRWHSDDIIGRLTDPENPHYNAEEARSWKIIRLPGLAEDDDPLGRKAGEPLWPERYDLDYHLANQRRDPLGFAALTQQRPTVADGILFRRETIQYYDVLPDELRFYASSDHAVGTKQRNDPSCFLKVGIDRQDNIYLIDCIWKRMPTDEAVEAMLAMAGGNMRPLLWWAERGHISKSIGPFLRKRMLETRTYINIVEVTPAVDKEQRAQSIAARVAMGKVLFPKHATWTEKAIGEMLAFPNGLHDDFCLIGATLVTMGDGRTTKAIADVRAGDYVLTRAGARRVLAARQTSPNAPVVRVDLSDGRALTMTPNHPVFVDGKGFVRADALAYGDVVFDERRVQTWRSAERLSRMWSSIKGSAIGVIRKASTGITASISTRLSRDVAFCTGISGKTRTALFQRAVKSIIGMKTRSTTASTISNVFPLAGTERSTSASGQKAITTTRTWSVFANWRMTGTPARKGDPGTGNMGARHGGTASPWRCAAYVAARFGKRISRIASSFATTPAVRVTGVEALTNPAPVYNIAVDAENEFFANGILTHNCDALAYIGLGLQSQFAPARAGTSTDVRKQPEFGTLAWVKWASALQDRQRELDMAGGF